MTPELIVFIVFFMPVALVFTVKYFNFREKELALRSGRDRKLLGGRDRDDDESDKERKQLEARIENLESIVCSVDFELNQRLNRVLGQTGGFAAARAPLGSARAAGALPAPEDGGGRPGQVLLSPGQVVVGRYTIERELGRGGMGAVYLAQDAKLGERVALKTLSTLLATDPEALLGSVRREVQAARRVTHPNVIRIHDLHEDGDLLFLSMEHVDGETLFSQVRRRGPLPVRESLEILKAVADGVAAAHAAGVVHRDLKPQNVLLGGTSVSRTIKVIDFGVAKASFLAGMTATGLIMGTPEYMAPEQVRGGEVDTRSDVYALGAMAYFVLCGRPPFQADTPIAVGFAQLQEVPPPLRQLRPPARGGAWGGSPGFAGRGGEAPLNEVPAALEAVLQRALAKDPAGRFPDAAALSAAYAALLQPA